MFILYSLKSFQFIFINSIFIYKFKYQIKILTFMLNEHNILFLEFIYQVLVLLDYFMFILIQNFISKIINLKLNTLNQSHPILFNNHIISST